jgi:hypothetical protein
MLFERFLPTAGSRSRLVPPMRIEIAVEGSNSAYHNVRHSVLNSLPFTTLVSVKLWM